MGKNPEELIKKISEKSDLKRSEVEEKIDQKEKEFTGLVSKEGAAYIVGKELGVNLLDKNDSNLKIENIVSGMNSVNTLGRVTQIFEPRSFERDDGEGKVCNLILADESGSIRMSLWDDQVNLIERDEVEEGDIIKIVNGYVKEDNRDNPDLRVGKSGKIKRGKGDLPSLEELKNNGGEDGQSSTNQGDINLADIKPNLSGKVKGNLIQLFGSKPFYNICPECGESLGDDNKCEEHGKVDPDKSIVVSGIIDDGKGSIRTVFFGENAEKLLDRGKKEIIEATEDGEEEINKLFEDVLNEEYVIRGNTRHNDFSDRIELIANSVKRINPEKEAEKLVQKLK